MKTQKNTPIYVKELESLNKKINIKHLESLNKNTQTRIIKKKLIKKLTQKGKKNTHYMFGGGEGLPAGWEAKGRWLGKTRRVAG